MTAEDKVTVDRQAERHEIKVWVYNSQNVTPDVQRVTSLVKAQHIPIATVTETLSPASDSFEQWQVAELEGLEGGAGDRDMSDIRARAAAPSSSPRLNKRLSDGVQSVQCARPVR